MLTIFMFGADLTSFLLYADQARARLTVFETGDATLEQVQPTTSTVPRSSWEEAYGKLTGSEVVVDRGPSRQGRGLRPLTSAGNGSRGIGPSSTGKPVIREPYPYLARAPRPFQNCMGCIPSCQWLLPYRLEALSQLHQGKPYRQALSCQEHS